jgi:3-oxoacyl-[acyl-carrier-protein] synthase-3
MSGGQRRSVILGTGSELPSNIITNHDLEKMVETSDEWITVRTGIKERRILEEGKGNADMAFHAATRALDDASLDASDLDAIIMGTVTADYPFPSSACVLEDMSAPPAPVFSMLYRLRILLSGSAKSATLLWSVLMLSAGC